MAMNLNYVNRKDVKPEDTIKKIKSIFENMDIKINELLWESHDSFWYSVRLEIYGLPHVGVNGKGISKEFALASAYGELMERFQSRTLIRPTFSVFKYNEFAFPDEIEMTKEDLIQSNSFLFNNFVDNRNIKNLYAVLQNNITIRHCLPFYSLTEHKTVYLPHKLINLCCGSNGLCAGNTKEEAIVQGISEIFERYAHMKIYNKTIQMFNIPLQEIKLLNSFSLIQQIINEGYDVSIKDCSMVETFPIIGLLVLNKEKNKYKFIMGCDPDIDIALQRCVTELFQGIKFDFSFEGKMKKLNWSIFEKLNNSFDEEWFLATVNNSGQHPIDIFDNHSDSKSISNYLNKKKESNKQYLKDIIKKLNKYDHKIYIRNHSSLGFPCYRVYIPSMTEFTKLSNSDLFYLKDEYAIKKSYCSLKTSNKKELTNLKISLEKLIDNPKYKFYGFPKALGNLIIDRLEAQEKLDYNLVLFLIYMQLKQSKSALKYFNLFIGENEAQFFNIEYIRAMRYFLIQQSSGFDEHRKNNLVKQEIVYDIYQDYKNNQTVNKYELPNCPNCRQCNIENCYYEIWNNLDEKLRNAEITASLSQDYVTN